jgi:hypothetical protein
MKSKKLVIGISLISILVITILITLLLPKNDDFTLKLGKYYLENNKDGSYINVISENEIRFERFDYEDLANEFVLEDTVATGANIKECLQKTLNYSLEKDGNMMDICVQVTENSGALLKFAPSEKTIDFREQIYYFSAQ